ncbi:MAG: NAD(P)H-binding protein [Deltaproteobacteria bacterium]|nr:NAD(P)H-binding protein [Deltaproteobacteria bacterium]
MLGATGAVGSRAAAAVARDPDVERLTTIGRRPVEGLEGDFVSQHTADIFDPSSYRDVLAGHRTAICTLGVGEPSKVDKEQFVKIDKLAVLDFATECKRAGVQHFQLLSSVGVDPESRSFFLRCKGELEDGLKALGFERLSLFHPSMILTPTNRYGVSQAIVLRVWPLLKFALVGPLRKYRGIAVETLGHAFAANVRTTGAGVETLEWDEVRALGERG